MWIVCLAFFTALLLAGASCRKQTPASQEPSADELESPEVVLSPAPTPPDLGNCTRLEIEFLPSVLDCLFPIERMQRILFSSQELEYLRALGTIPVDDVETISAFARDLASAGYYGPEIRGVASKSLVRIMGYAGQEQVVRLFVAGPFVRVDGGGVFEYQGIFQKIVSLAPAIQGLQSRRDCMFNVEEITGRLWRHAGETGAFPPASRWCDTLYSRYLDGDLPGHLVCPSAQNERLRYAPEPALSGRAPEAVCNYALNPNCEPNSPPDMVLLFEAKPGWNQHGGPELFTFDNHDPRGGCVVLNDGTVRFIRTEEELNALRWE
jgi:hypothetical protein